jgi:glutamate/tyrosine decarboxylase-like PLP-dependent enzyme
MTHAFEWTADDHLRIGGRVAELVAGHLSALPDEPSFRPVPPALAARLRDAPLAATGESVDALLEWAASELLPYPFGNGHPRFHGWVNPPPAPIGVWAAALAAAMNPSNAGGNHAGVYVERAAVRWCAELLGLPADMWGLLVSGGSAAAITALTAARHAACTRRGWDIRAEGVQGIAARLGAAPFRLYLTAEGHSCNAKAAELLGFGASALRHVPSDGALRMRPDALDAMLAEDLAAGLVPVAVIASAGTVNTGTVDPLETIADVCARHDVWLHVDGAYGAPAAMLPELADRFRGLARADSVAMDPHKWLYVPADCGLVLVRDAANLRDAVSLVPPYLRIDGDEHGVQGPVWYSEYGLEQTRAFRALKLWFVLRHFGADGMRAMIRQDIANARALEAALGTIDGVEVWQPSDLSMACFRLDSGDVPADDAATRRLLAELQLGGGFFPSGTTFAGRFWVRACYVNPRTTPAQLGTEVAEIRAAIGRVRGASPAG